MKIRSFHFILATVIFLSAGITTTHVQAQGCSDYSYYLGWRAQDMPPYDHLGWAPSVLGLKVVGNLAYVSASGYGLAIYDMTDPTNPVLLGMADTPYNCWDVDVAGDYAYVADWHSPGFCVIEVADPTNPLVIGSTGGSSANYTRVAVAKADTVYVVDNYHGVRVFDVTDPTDPAFAGLITTGGFVWDLDVQDEYLYVIDDINGLWIFDMALSANEPDLVGHCELPDYNSGVHVVGDYAYVAASHEGLQIVDVSDKEDPQVVGVLPAPDAYAVFNYVHVVDNMAYVTVGGGSFAREGLLIVNVDYPSAPYVVNSLGIYFQNAHDVFVADDFAYVTAGNKGLFVADVSNPRFPPFFSSFSETDYLPTIVEASGDYAYVLDNLNGLRVFDITTAPAATIVGNLGLSGNPRNLEIVGDLAYLADGGGGLKVIDISIPSSPGLLGSVAPFGNQVDVAVQGDFAYVAAENWGLQIIDVSNSALPTERGGLDPSSFNAIAVDVQGNHAFLACGFDGLYAIDITNPDDPSEVGHFVLEDDPTNIHLGDAGNVHISGDFAFISGYEDGVFVLDISTPSSMSLVSILVTPGYVFDVIVDGDLAYIADYDGGLQIADYTDIANPRYLGCTDTPAKRALDISLVGNQVCLADWEGGFHVLPKHCVPTGVSEGDLPTAAGQLTAYPNPFNPQSTISFSLEKPEAARITLFSADGRPVRVLADRTFPAGPNTASWNGRDDRGRGLPSGSYLVRVETESGIRKSKVTLLK